MTDPALTGSNHWVPPKDWIPSDPRLGPTLSENTVLVPRMTLAPTVHYHSNMSGIEAIGQALSYDAVESILASGGSLALALRFAVAALPAIDGEEECPTSVATVLAPTLF